MYVVVSDDRSVFFFIGGPLCGFLRATLYPAQVPGSTKLYLLLSIWCPGRLEWPFSFCCSEQLTRRCLLSLTLFSTCLCNSALETKEVVWISIYGQRLIPKRMSGFSSLHVNSELWKGDLSCWWVVICPAWSRKHKFGSWCQWDPQRVQNDCVGGRTLLLSLTSLQQWKNAQRKAVLPCLCWSCWGSTWPLFFSQVFWSSSK